MKHIKVRPGNLNVAVGPQLLEDLVVVVRQHLPLLLQQSLQQNFHINVIPFRKLPFVSNNVGNYGRSQYNKLLRKKT